MSVSRILGAMGRILIGLGLLILLFVVYLLWGTGISEAHHQTSLKHTFQGAIGQARRESATPKTQPARSLVQQLVSGEAPAEGQPLAVIDIPKIGADDVVVQGTGAADLRLGPGHYAGTPLPGQRGNSGIAGHRTTYGAPFSKLDQLSLGDTILVTTLQGRFTFRVTQTVVVPPTDVSVLDPSSTPMLTLTTCTPRFSASERLVVHAALVLGTDRTPGPLSPGSEGRPGVASKSTLLAGTQGPWAGAIVWGAVTLLVSILAWLFGRSRQRRRACLATYAAALVPVLVLLYLFFENVSPLLPASY